MSWGGAGGGSGLGAPAASAVAPVSGALIEKRRLELTRVIRQPSNSACPRPEILAERQPGALWIVRQPPPPVPRRAANG